MLEQNNLTNAEIQIINAKRAYLLELSKGTGAATRYAIYTENEQGLDVLWCKEMNYDDKSKSKLFPYQVYSKANNLPAFHFKVSGYGLSRSNELRRMLQDYNPNIEVLCLGGWAPSTSF